MSEKKICVCLFSPAVLDNRIISAQYDVKYECHDSYE